MIEKHPSMKRNIILREVSNILIVPILIFALYVQWHGDFGPGGGFQAGVIFAVGVVLYALVYGLEKVQKVFTPRAVQIGVAGGLLLYIGVGILAMFGGGNFLDYSALTGDARSGQHYGILAIELGVGITVASVMISIFCSFAGRGK